MSIGKAATVLALAKAGDIRGAIAAGEAVLAAGPLDAALTLFVGMLCCREGDFARGIPHLRSAVAAAPRELGAKVELARALFASGALSEADEVASPLASVATPAGREMQRIRAHVMSRLDRADEAGALFEQLTRSDADDFESWDGLGVARLATGDYAGAIVALDRATALRPTAIAYRINLARAHAASGDFVSAADAARNAVAGAPADAAAQLELGRALAGLNRDEEALAALAAARAAAPDNAQVLTEIGDLQFTCKAPEQAGISYRAALALEPALRQGLLGLAKVLERLNQTAELLALLDEAEALGVETDSTALMRALALRSEGRLEEAFAAAHGSRTDFDEVARAQLIGDLADRLGETETAFAAFSQANDLLAAGAVDSAQAAADYLETFRRIRNILTPAWYASWGPAAPPQKRRSPLFIFGFPRSGTTLIDTMLSGHPDAVVMEEGPVIDRVAEMAGPVEHIAQLTHAAIERLRDRYFEEVDRLLPDAGSCLIVDKHPLALGNAPLLHRLFPEARFVFVERHPCDVVLSCFITSSRMDSKVASFFSFTGTARLYDRVLAFWERCTTVLPIAVHTIRYETLIADPETELRRLADFAGLDWTDKLLAHQSNATARGYIGSPSYAQVAEPIYTRAKGRWLRYREHMAPVIPILRPWIERMGYDAG